MSASTSERGNTDSLSDSAISKHHYINKNKKIKWKEPVK